MSIDTSPRPTSTTRSRTTRPAAPSEAAGVWLVAEREIALEAAQQGVPDLDRDPVRARARRPRVRRPGGPESVRHRGRRDRGCGIPRPVERGLEITEVADRAAAEELVADGTVDAAIVGDPSAEPFGFTVVADSSAPTQLLLQFAQVPPVELLNPEPTDDALRYLVAIGFGIVFLIAASLFGGTIAQSVVEEKQTRVVEILISAIPRAHAAGGQGDRQHGARDGADPRCSPAIAVVGLTDHRPDAAARDARGARSCGSRCSSSSGSCCWRRCSPRPAAMVSRQEDIGSTTTPLTMLIMAPYFLVIFFNDNPVVLTIMSYVPFSAPVGMPMRLFLGEAQWWEPLLSLAILIATCVGGDPGRREDLPELAAADGRARQARRGAARLTRRPVSRLLVASEAPSDKKWDTVGAGASGNTFR